MSSPAPTPPNNQERHHMGLISKISQAFKKYSQLIFIAFFIFIATIGCWSFAARMMARNVGRMVLEKKDVVTSNWGGSLNQTAPSLKIKSNYQVRKPVTEEDQLKSDEESSSYILPSQQKLTSNIKILSSKIDAKLNMDHRRKGLTYFPTYVTNFNAQYIIENQNEEEVEATMNFPLPGKNSLVWNVGITSQGSEEGATITSHELSWSGTLQPQEQKTIEVVYAARGLDQFTYALANTKGLQDFELNVDVTGAEKVDFPEGALSPSVTEEKDHGWNLTWKFNQVLTSPEITVKLFAKRNISQDVARLFWFAPILLTAVYASIWGLNQLENKSIKVFDWGLIGALYIMFYPLLAYLVSVVDQLNVFQGLAISAATISIISLYLYHYLYNVKFTLTKGVLLQIIFLGFFPIALLMPQLTGLMAVIGAIFILTVIVQLRKNLIRNKVKK